MFNTVIATSLVHNMPVTYQGVDILSFVDQHPNLFWITTENRLDQWRLEKENRSITGLFIFCLN